MEVARKCLNCGADFTVPDHYVRKGKGKFCTVGCYHEHRAGKVRGPYQKSDLTEHECPVCGKVYKVGGAGNRDRKSKYCSRKCQRAAHAHTGKSTKQLAVADAAYIAGFIDGEGSITLVKRPSGTVTLRVFASNCHKETLEWLKTTTGVGSVTPHQRGNAKHAPSWYWNCAANAAETLLRQIRPYMHIKTAHADVVLELRDKLKDPAYRADKEWQAEYHERLRLLNRRGPKEM